MTVSFQTTPTDQIIMDHKCFRPTVRFVRLASTAALLALAISHASSSAIAEKDYSQETARSAQAWLRAGVIYEIFPRNFSVAGNFNAVTARLDELHDLGVSILWLMPVYPTGNMAVVMRTTKRSYESGHHCPVTHG